ncbi:MAG: exodeoxyribonuclease VII large subunit, partial [Blastocatellia bacterium]
MSRSSILEQLTRPRKPLSVSELAAKIKTLIEGRFLDLWVEGEISNFRKQSSGHWYFSLKDEAAVIRCAFFRSQNRLMRFEPADGMVVKARGRVSTYEDRSEYQLLVELLELSGHGAGQLAFEQLKQKLAAEGLFDQARKRALPTLPRRIGVVTSPTGAAIRDIIRTLRRRNEGVSILLAPVRVQGAGAAEEIADGIDCLNVFGGVDAIIVGRGGGSSEDLSCFNDERVARAICRSAAPVISAVGHETDFTIADFAADLRASTPSAAAELVASVRDDISHRVVTLNNRLQTVVRLPLLRAHRSLASLRSDRAFNAMPGRVNRLAQRVDDRTRRLESAVRLAMRSREDRVDTLAAQLQQADARRTLDRHNNRLRHLKSRLDMTGGVTLARSRERFSVAATKLNALSPLSVLSRGYA